MAEDLNSFNIWGVHMWKCLLYVLCFSTWQWDVWIAEQQYLHYRNLHSACFCVNSDRRLITDAERKSMASRCAVLQRHSWVVQVIITSPTWFCMVARSHPGAGKRIWGEICHLLHTTHCWIRKCQRQCALLPTLTPGLYITLLV